MALSRPLVIAAIAMVLLIGSVTFEVGFQQAYSVQVRDGAAWRTIGETASDPTRSPTLALSRAIVAPANGSVEFRLRIDNGRPWAASEHYDVIVGGLNVADGTITAPARGVGESAFSVPVSSLVNPNGGAPLKESPASNVTFVNFDVEVAGRQVYANFQLQEAS
jgi:hypothetical protein